MNTKSTRHGTLALFGLAAGDRPAGGLTQKRWSTVVPAPLDVTFAFFSNAANLERLTPPWVNFRIRTPLPVVMRVGLEIDYRIVVRGLPIPWRSRIEVWEPGVRFVDRQLIGPYRWWWHTHEFEAMPEGTRVIDVVEFKPRAAWVTAGFVQRDVERIFEYRRQALGQMDW
jgi:ligand-binding SRPBCC domain-containing protein